MDAVYNEWVRTSAVDVGMVCLSAFCTYVAIIAFCRIAGLRSFSKMSSADFAMTVAVGSLFASTISSPSPKLVLGLVALASLFFLQWLIAVLRSKSDAVSNLVDNKPVLLMAGRKILDGNLKRAKVSRDDLFAKLREANALSYDHVVAVIFETTGDISVLHSSESNASVEPDFVRSVRDSHHLVDQS